LGLRFFNVILRSSDVITSKKIGYDQYKNTLLCVKFEPPMTSLKKGHCDENKVLLMISPYTCWWRHHTLMPVLLSYKSEFFEIYCKQLFYCILKRNQN